MVHLKPFPPTQANKYSRACCYHTNSMTYPKWALLIEDDEIARSILPVSDFCAIISSGNSVRNFPR